jgi:hypothetical protein
LWVGGSINPPAPAPKPKGGGSIQPLSSWFYYSETAPDTLMRELTDQSLVHLRTRGASVRALGTNATAWRARVGDARAALEKVFAPLPPKNRTATPPFRVVRTLRRPTYTCDLVLFETRPGFWATGAIWTPLDAAGGAPVVDAPAVLLVSGHTPDGFRSNNRHDAPRVDNAPPEDDYEVVITVTVTVIHNRNRNRNRNRVTVTTRWSRSTWWRAGSSCLPSTRSGRYCKP